MKIQTILFDLDNTLIDFKSTFLGAAEKTLADFGVTGVEKSELDRYYEVNDRIWFGKDLEHSDREEICRWYHIGYNEYLVEAAAALKEQFGLKGEVNRIDEVFRQNMGRCAKPMPHIFETLELLKKDFQLCVATNGMHDLQSYKLARFAGCFERCFISEDLDRVKPEREFYLRIAEALGRKPEELLMVGDSLQNDIGGALGAGLRACYYDPTGSVRTGTLKPTYVIRDFSELPALLR